MALLIEDTLEREDRRHDRDLMKRVRFLLRIRALISKKDEPLTKLDMWRGVCNQPDVVYDPEEVKRRLGYR